ncbi:MAG: DUF6011 domain-containing protein [Promicromonosporaceae bacterium]|nr:DUF6011 domain-containing protein [Promicromonosporaceae bacterium]
MSSSTASLVTAVSPSTKAPRREGMRWWTRVLLFHVFIAPVFALHMWAHVPAGVMAVALAITWLSLRSLVTKHADPNAPLAPVRQVAELPSVRPEPARRIHVLGYTCEICGRSLTNAESQRARVGSECIKSHGPRYRFTANPDHDRWAEEDARARVYQVVKQAELNQLHERAMDAHALEVENWAAELTSPEAAERARLRRKAKFWRSVVGVAFWTALAGQFAIGHALPTADQNSPDAVALKSAVSEYTVAYFKGDEKQAVDAMWSRACLAESGPSSAARSLINMNGATHGSGYASDITVIRLDAGEARVSYKYSSGQKSGTVASQPWVFEFGGWKFDDC